MHLKIKKVCIIGKTNVGKSQLFNRIIGHKHALVMDKPGVTRDRITILAEWLRYKFYVTDTGGFSVDMTQVDFQKEINKQLDSAIKESDLAIFVISKKDGINKDDFDIAKMLKKSSIPTILAINKCDILDIENDNFSHVGLGFGEGIYISAEHGINTGQLLDKVTEKLNIYNDNCSISPNPPTTFAIIGKPNAGKSSICNVLLQEERLIVSPISGTTNDAIKTVFSYNHESFELIDTPGIKKNKWIKKNKQDYLFLLKAKQSIQNANVICLIIDLATGVTEIDISIASLVAKANIPCILVANKWDLVNYRTHEQRDDLSKEIRSKINFLDWAPLVFISALEKHNIGSIFKALSAIRKEMKKLISETDLRQFMIKISSTFNIPRVENKKIELYKIKQVPSQILTFVINCNDTNLLHFSYSRLVENKFRESFDIKYCPIKFYYRSKNKVL